ncbi:alpha/beta-type small acid-soluble spore protein [Clostridium oryzae]|uniref:Small, acid-soluble spore protein C2 n=1 Tax=Clostridium oryzae TaxID=1450648 RepID=A0A1V4IR07_9CLOT|nr:alpha/beta-type small acid-soluble spore protein [Clostridium oryzae]OPJ62452.1 small, acid-soluble spore protein C2 [Clostridium oryzae]
MSRRNRVLVPEARQGLENFKMEAAREVGVNLSDGDNGNKTSRENGSVGGQMTKRMVESYESKLK